MISGVRRRANVVSTKLLSHPFIGECSGRCRFGVNSCLRRFAFSGRVRATNRPAAYCYRIEITHHPIRPPQNAITSLIILKEKSRFELIFVMYTRARSP